MISDSPNTRGSSSGPVRTTRPLKRGKACMNCRFLKIKCDGVKPVCGPCRRHPKDDDCEYSDGPGRSRTKALEDQVTRLEARLQELENPDATTPSVKLHDPYAQFHETQRISKSPPLYIPAEPTITLGPLSPFSPTSTASSLPSGRHWNTFSALEANTESTGSSGTSQSPMRPVTTATSPFLGAEEPSFLLIQNLLDKFLPHASQFGFFLHIPTFRSNTLLSVPFGNHSRPTPALLSVVYLWGVHLSHSEALLLQEQAFLTRALQHVSTDMLGAHPHRIIHTLQAQILLAYYFFRTGRFLEAKWQTGSAISLALGSGFHKLRCANIVAPATLGLAHDMPVYFDAPHTTLEEGERINGFWAVFSLHKLISVALEPPFNVCGALEAPGIQIDAPWPLDMSQYLEGLLTPDIQGNATVRSFLNGLPPAPHSGADSTTALLTKASILLHRATHLTGQWTPNMQQREFQAFAAAFQTVHRLIEGFRALLPAIAGHEANDPGIRDLILTHALADAAIIKLHSIFSYADSSSKQHCLNAARNIIQCGGVNLQEVGYLNPMMGTLWMIACHVFIDEVSRIRSHQPWPEVTPQAGVGELTEEELMEFLRNGITYLSLYSEDSVLTREFYVIRLEVHLLMQETPGYQLTKVQEAYSAI